ncbi:MAG: hypothetical protein A2527_07510 [Candidatus Lambdaproteobacteria bacterium RIFOXYD2_FULL_50_16]|uniref:Flagellar FliJ protein n=1 Tax=Candidatus Lambdaproteobacteria bacterium RIFOXYD2_FULL_50_16 TaxID=1817772 RepID=A0A1F6GBA6_9PROT|nr:MAG: hypothetical protein A2527_07510 [Candidatus Lambdaproteobacteria bacterium RIFOXYD2_FULL_50_16]
MFRFSMQTALDVRGKQERVKMKEMAERLAVQQGIEAGIAKIDQALIDADQKMNLAKRSGLLDLGSLRQIEGFKYRSKVERGRLEAKHKEAVRATEVKRLELIEAARRRRTLEILRDREEGRYTEHLARIERAFVDETATNQFVQRQRQA